MPDSPAPVDTSAIDAALYTQLRSLAASQRRRFGSAAHTMGTTAVVHELYLRFAGGSGVDVESQRHFFALSARMMRQILVDHARRRALAPMALDPEFELAVEEAATVREVDDALRRLESVNARLARVVECRYFAGYTEPETAEILGVTDRTVRRDWDKARAWLAAAIT
ncbi:MAG: ECF-type sigma factor [Dokdonella sp.]|uniref:ECF-type sigma factor n=1 Tax=Dokdonella sp. TaxID=2291710 RepID=UPI002D11F3A6|nr:ECF-type sigma factor [Dokdonella sp.]HOX72138.1 ECF-type sigma factor [Dokdonella sp.]HPG94851.1 ECF-type sigma factor [Dokdonella sp.]